MKYLSLDVFVTAGVDLDLTRIKWDLRAVNHIFNQCCIKVVPNIPRRIAFLEEAASKSAIGDDLTMQFGAQNLTERIRLDREIDSLRTNPGSYLVYVPRIQEEGFFGLSQKIGISNRNTKVLQMESWTFPNKLSHDTLTSAVIGTIDSKGQPYSHSLRPIGMAHELAHNLGQSEHAKIRGHLMFGDNRFLGPCIPGIICDTLRTSPLLTDSPGVLSAAAKDRNRGKQ